MGIISVKRGASTVMDFIAPGVHGRDVGLMPWDHDFSLLLKVNRLDDELHEARDGNSSGLGSSNTTSFRSPLMLFVRDKMGSPSRGVRVGTDGSIGSSYSIVVNSLANVCQGIQAVRRTTSGRICVAVAVFPDCVA